MLLPMTFGEKIAAVARDRGLDLTEVAAAAGISYDTLRNYLRPRSKTRPSAPTGIALAKALGVNPVWLFDDAAGMPPAPFCEGPPFPIYPWPPAITWDEVQAAIVCWILELHRHDIATRTTNVRWTEKKVAETIAHHMDLRHGKEGMKRAWDRLANVAKGKGEHR